MTHNTYLQSQENHNIGSPASGHQHAAAAQATDAGAGLLGLIMENSGNGMMLVDHSLQIRFFNQQAATVVAQVLGVDVKKGQPAASYCFAGYKQQYCHALTEALAGRTAFLEMNGANVGSGTLRLFAVHFQPVPNGAGLKPEVLITWSEKAPAINQYAEAVQLRKKTGLILDNLTEGFVLLDRNLHIQLFNKKAALEMFHLTKMHLEVGKPIFDYALGSQDLHSLNHLFEAALAGKPQEAEYNIAHPESTITLQVKYLPAFDNHGAIEGVILSATNITYKHQSENALADTEKRWRFALEGSNQGVWDWDIINDRVYYSEAWYQMFGYLPLEVGHSMDDYEEMLHPDDRDVMRNHRSHHFNSPVSFYESEFRLRSKDGHYRWVLSRGMIMERTPEGNPTRMIGTHTDITARKAVEEKYKVLFYKNPIPMWTYDQNTLGFLEVNEAAVRQYGYTLDEFQRITILDIRPEEDRTLLLEDINTRKLAQEKPSAIWRHCKKDGEIIWVNITAFTFQEDFQHITLVTAENVSQKIAAEEKLKSSEALYRHLFRSIPLPAFIYDTKTLEIKEANDRAITFYGYTARELTGMNLLDLKEGREEDSILHYVLNNKSTSANIRTWQHRTKKGEPRKVELWASSIGLNSNRLRLVIVNDITDKERAEAEVRASSERFRYVMNATNDIVWDWQVGAEQVLWSDHYRDILGWALPPDNHLPFAQMMESFHPDDRDRVFESMQQALYQSTDALWENAFRYKRNDGSYAYVLDKGFILRRPDGTAYRMIGAMHDISSEQYQQELQELELRIFALSSKPETKLQQVLENIAGGVEQLHHHLRVCVVYFPNAHRTHIVAKRMSSGMQQWLHQFVEEHKHKWPKSPLRKGLTTHSLELDDRKFLTGEWNGFLPKQVLSLPANNSDGSLMATLLVFIGNDRGLTNAEWNALYRLQNLLRLLVVQHVAVEQIRMANERFDNVLKATHDLIWDWDLLSGSFYRSPEALNRLYGVSQESEISNVHDWLGRIHPEDHDKVHQIIREILSGNVGDGFDVEYRFKRDDGTYTYLYDRGIIIRNQQGTPVRMIGAAQDISERKHLQQELLQQELDRQRVISQATIDTQEQERAEIGRELHDNVNQILTTTKLYLELAQSNHDMKDELVIKASKNIIHVINEIRQLSRSLMDPSIGDLGLTASIRDLAENINLTRKINIKLTLDEALDNVLDESRKLMVFRIVQEAMSNIIKHANASNVHIKLKKQGSIVSLQITDNGIGFDPEGVKTGIGLKNIRNRVFLSHGTLQIIAAPHKGATLKILFPLQKSPQ